MTSTGRRRNPILGGVKTAVAAGLFLAIALACGILSDDPAPSPTLPPSERPPLMGERSPVTVEQSPGDSEPTITIEIEPEATPFPTATPHPTPTSLPTALPTPTPGAVPPVSTPVATPVATDVSAKSPTPIPAAGTSSSEATPTPTSEASPVVSSPVAAPTSTAPAAAPPGPSTETTQFTIKRGTELKHPKVGSALDDLIARVQAGEISAEEAAQETPLHRGDSIGVAIHLSGNVGGVVRFLEGNGALNITARGDYIEAYVPVLVLVETSEQQGVIRVRPIQPPEGSQSGNGIPGNGPAVHGSTAWNQAGYTGRGIKVGVIDVGFDGFADLMGTEVPASVQVRCYRGLGEHSQNLEDCENREEHGTGVVEAVMDIVPDVTLYIADPRSSGDLSDTVDWMISEGVTVINHSANWLFDGYGDGTSPYPFSPLNMVDRAVAAGIVWVNAAGNSAELTWFQRGPFSYSTVDVGGEAMRVINFEDDKFKNRFHLWGPLQLRWDDTWSGASNNLDLFLVWPDTYDIALRSINPQSGRGWHEPFEATSAHQPFDVMIAHRGGDEPGWIQLLAWKGNSLTYKTPETGSITSPGESANPGMLTVGAAAWGHVSSIEYFSSRGPTPDGRTKPDIVAADCGESVTYPELSSRSGCWFRGTSQAAPHVAGLAALVRQRFPDFSPAQVVSYLKKNAEQRINSPDPNNTWGHGFIVLPPNPPQHFGAPSIDSVTAGVNSLSMLWSAPAGDGGSPITAYDLRYIETSVDETVDSNWTVVDDVWTSGADALSHELTGLRAGTQYDLQVRALNSTGGGPWSSTVTGTPTIAETPCSTRGAVPDPNNNPALVADCDTLLAVRDTLAGNGTLNWSASAPITSWNGVEVGGTPQRVTVLYLVRQRLTGIIPPELGSLTGLDQLTLIENQLTGPIPSELGNLSNLRGLYLFSNRLAGSIPTELGRLTNLQGLGIYDNRLTGSIPSQLTDVTNLEALHVETNQLTGPIPPELGRLANLQWLTLHDNQLTGEVPDELGRLTKLEQLWLGGNQFTGCVSAELRSIRQIDRTHRLKEIGIPYCDELLSGLSITPGTLSPQFDEFSTDYTVATRSSRITFSPTNRYNATFEYLDGDDNVLADLDNSQAGHQIDVPAGGVTTIRVRVIAPEHRFGWHTYIFHVTGPGTLGAPAIKQIAPGTNSLTVHWAAPSTDGGSSITAYDLRHIETSADKTVYANWTVVYNVWMSGSGAISYELTGLAGGTPYDVQLRAVNADGDGLWSVTVTGTTRGAVPGSPTGLAATENSQTQIYLAWSAPSEDGGTAVTGYRIEVSPDGSTWANLVVDSRTITTSYSHTGLVAGSTRHYRVSAINAEGSGPASNVASATTEAPTVKRPDAPSGLTATANSQTQIDLVWSAPSEDGGTAVTGYWIEVSPNGSAWADLVVDSRTATTSYSHTRLMAGSTRHYRVSAINAEGSGPASNVASATTEAPTVKLPDAPSGLTATANGQTQIDLSWSAPVGTPTTSTSRTSFEAATPLGYTAIALRDSGSIWGGPEKFTSDSSLETVAYMLLGTLKGCSFANSETARSSMVYVKTDQIGRQSSFESESVCRKRSSSWSSFDGLRVTHLRFYDESSPANVREYTYESASGQYAETSTGSGSGGVSAINGYRIEVSEDGSNWSDLVSDTRSSGNSYSHTGLMPNSTRYYRVSAINSAGTGPASNAARTSTGSAPDLVVDAPTVDTSAPAAGARFTLSATVRNQGNGESSFTTLRYYQSTDSAITTSDTEVGTDYVFRLDPSESGDGSVSLTAPSIPGAYYYGSCVDAVSDESDTTNNCSSSVTVTVGAAPAPDLVVDAPVLSNPNPVAGTSFPISATVRNQGNDRSDSTTLRYYRSTDATITTFDTVVGTSQVGGLSTSETQEVSTILPGLPTPGAYYYGACVDAVSDESDTANNCSSAVVITVSSPTENPDLVVDMGGPTSSGVAGKAFMISLAVRNQGTGPSSATILRYYLSTDTVITTDDTEVGATTVEGIPGASYARRSISLTAPPIPGTYYYGACVDAVPEESNTDNNCSSSVMVTINAASDLVISDFNVSNSTQAATAKFRISAKVTNQGEASSSSSVDVNFYVSTDAIISSSDTQLATRFLSRLDASQEGLPMLGYPNAPGTAGTYYYGACVDSVINESNTGNNCSSGTRITVIDAPDPRITAVDCIACRNEHNPLLPAGSSIRLTGYLENNGNLRSAPTTLWFYLSTDFTITTADTLVSTESVVAMDPKQEAFVSSNVNVPTTPGAYYYGACLAEVSGESDTSNNCSPPVVANVGAGPPDLVVDTPTASPSSPDAGASFTLSATVSNQGSGSSGSTTLRYYRSDDSSISSSDTAVGTDSVGGLSTSGTSTQSISLTAPSTAGTYYYGACLDSVSGESDTTNNCSSGVAVAVGTPPAPDLVVDTPTASPSSPTAGASFTLRATVRNQGDGPSASTTLRYYRFTAPIIPGSGTAVGTDPVDGLSASGTSPESISLTAPSTAGTYYYSVCVDAVSGESDTTNNCSSGVAVAVGTPPAPDLVVDTPTASPSSPDAGASFTLRATVRNHGDGSSGSTTLQYYRSTNSTISSSDTPVGSDAVSVLAGSAAGDESIELAAPSTPGTYFYGACVDSVPGEADTGNNCSAAVEVTVGAEPVVITLTGCSATYSEATQITRVEINGTVSVNTSFFTLTITGYVDDGDAEVEIDNEIFVNLDAGDTASFELSGTYDGNPGDNAQCLVRVTDLIQDPR